jgi:Ser/Thr protein kinase RdoA (MazF antagonist)
MSFARLSEAEQVAALTRLARNALAAWDREDSLIELLKYRENAVFAIMAGDGTRTILRVHRPDYRTDDHIRSEIAWRHALNADGIANPPAIAARGGEYVVTAAGEGVPEARQCDLMQWVQGNSPGTLEGGVVASSSDVHALYRQVGALAARLEGHAAKWERPAWFSRPSWDVAALVGESPTFGCFWQLDGIGEDQMSTLMAARDRLRERLCALGPAGVLIHGDLVPDNILIDGATTRVIDFDDFGWSWPGLEMATSLFPLRLSGGYDAGLSGYLEGYRGVRPFPAGDLELLPDLLMARALSYLGWPAGRPEIESARQLVPMMIYMVTESAREYLQP